MCSPEHEQLIIAACGCISVLAGLTERDLLKARGTGIVHCPNSNYTLGSGVLNVRRLLNEGIKVGLGTDVAGGFSPTMLDAIRMARTASMTVAMLSDGRCKAEGEQEGEQQQEEEQGGQQVRAHI